jgi:hypothetical protein
VGDGTYAASVNSKSPGVITIDPIFSRASWVGDDGDCDLVVHSGNVKFFLKSRFQPEAQSVMYLGTSIVVTAKAKKR